MKSCKTNNIKGQSMRVINEYKFYFGTAVSFSEIPDRIHRFLDNMGLKSNRYCVYYYICIGGLFVCFLIVGVTGYRVVL